MSVQLRKRYFNVDDYYRMAEAGLFSEGERVELIEGEVVEMSPIGSRHAGCVMRSSTVLNRRFGHLAIVSVQNPIRLDDFSEPQPDLALLKPRKDFYSTSHPTAADVLVVIEVADTSADYDRNVKLPLYAAQVYGRRGWLFSPKTSSKSTRSRRMESIRKFSG
jgi:Uma2 family endonuclease